MLDVSTVNNSFTISPSKISMSSAMYAPLASGVIVNPLLVENVNELLSNDAVNLWCLSTIRLAGVLAGVTSISTVAFADVSDLGR